MLETTFHGRKTFRFVGGSLSWSETPYFHKGGPLRMVPKLPLSPEICGKNFYVKQLYLGNQVTVTPELGLKLKIFARTLISGVQEKREKFGDRSAPPLLVGLKRSKICQV